MSRYFRFTLIIAGLSLILVAIVLLTSCSVEPRIREGTVQGTGYHPHTVVKELNCRNPFGCDDKVYPEKCILVIAEHGTERVGEVEVPCDRQFRTYNKGDWWSRDGKPRPSTGE